MSEKIWQRLPNGLLWLSLIILLVLTPIVFYTAQSQSSTRLLETKDSLNEHRELMNSMRMEAALLHSGYKKNPGETLLKNIQRYHDSAEKISEALEFYSSKLKEVMPLWHTYEKRHHDFQTLIQRISADSAAYNELLAQSHFVYNNAKQEWNIVLCVQEPNGIGSRHNQFTMGEINHS